MAQQTIATTDSPETGRGKINDNFTELYATALPVGTKKYVALLTQSGTSAPVATVLENTLGGTVVWSYSGIGSYNATLAGAFTENKTFINPSKICLMSDGSTSDNVIIIHTSANVINVATSILDGGSNGVLTNFPISITVYP